MSNISITTSDSRAIKNAIDHAIRHSGKRVNNVLENVLIERKDGGIQLVATDSFRIYLSEMVHAYVKGEDESLVLPLAAAKWIRSEVKVSHKDAALTITREGDDISLTYRAKGVLTKRATFEAIYDRYPNHRAIVDERRPNYVMTMDAGEIIQAASCEDGVHGVMFDPISRTVAFLDSEQNYVSTVSIGMDVTFPNQAIGTAPVLLNWKFVRDALRVFTGRVGVYVEDSNSPSIITDGEGESLCLVMPIRYDESEKKALAERAPEPESSIESAVGYVVVEEVSFSETESQGIAGEEQEAEAEAEPAVEVLDCLDDVRDLAARLNAGGIETKPFKGICLWLVGISEDDESFKQRGAIWSRKKGMWYFKATHDLGKLVDAA